MRSASASWFFKRQSGSGSSDENETLGTSPPQCIHCKHELNELPVRTIERTINERGSGGRRYANPAFAIGKDMNINPRQVDPKRLSKLGSVRGAMIKRINSRPHHSSALDGIPALARENPFDCSAASTAKLK